MIITVFVLIYIALVLLKISDILLEVEKHSEFDSVGLTATETD